MSNTIVLADGYRHVALGDVGSTNTEAFRRSDGGETPCLWLTAERQTIGRGRGERTWTSEPGNLYATLLLHLDVPFQAALQLPFVAGVAVHDAITQCCEVPDLDLALKWPNDVLLNDCKVCGILVESRKLVGRETLAVAMGFGVNVAHHPVDTRHPAIHLAKYRPEITSSDVFTALTHSVAQALDHWANGEGFATIRKLWQDRALLIGRTMSVSEGPSRTEGIYAGLDVDGALLLNVSGKTRRILFGDVMFPAPDGAFPKTQD